MAKGLLSAGDRRCLAAGPRREGHRTRLTRTCVHVHAHRGLQEQGRELDPFLFQPGRPRVGELPCCHTNTGDAFAASSATSPHSVSSSFLPPAQTMRFPSQTSCRRWSAGRGRPCRSRRTRRRARRLQIPVLVSGCRGPELCLLGLQHGALQASVSPARRPWPAVCRKEAHLRVPGLPQASVTAQPINRYAVGVLVSGSF